MPRANTIQKLNNFLFANFRIMLKYWAPFIVSCFFSQAIFAQQVVSGTVLTNDSVPLKDVTINVKNTHTSVLTDENGRFSIAAAQNATLVISYIGYETEEIPVNGQSTISVELKPSLGALDQVVVTGYTRQVKKDITGSVVVVDVGAVKSIPTGTPEKALQGQAAGVTVITSGAPGGESDIFIRGVTSFGNTQPLIIVDGIQGSLHDINAADIESIQVLKDAGAAAIYGVRGSNGVIIVTTKKGKTGAPQISFDSYLGYKVPPEGNVFNIASPADMAAFVKKMTPDTKLFPNGVLPDYLYAGPGVVGIANEGDPAVDPSKYVFDENNPSNDYLIQRVPRQGTDWFHQVFKPAWTQNYALSVNGGGEKATYLLSLNYLNEQGTLIETYLKRYAVRINTSYHIGKNIRIGENAYIFSKENPSFSNQDQDNAIFMALAMPPFIPVYDIAGHYGGTWIGPELGDRWNPVAMLKNTHYNHSNTWGLLGNVYGEIDFLKHFTFRTSIGGTLNDTYFYNFFPNRYHDKEQHTSVNSYNENSMYERSWIFTNTLNYSALFGRHDVKLLAGSEAIKNSGRAVGGSSAGFFSTDPYYLVLNNGTSAVTNYSGAHSDQLYSLFGRLDYAYGDKYLASATVRRDGSSRFGTDKTYGVFPSFSLGWRLSQENFMKNIAWLDDLKLRGSWGKLGSQNNVSPTNPFTLFSSDFGLSYYDISGNGTISQGFYQSNIGNANTGWEQDVVTNIGLDFTLLKHRIDGSVEWYKKSINGLLFPQPLPATIGGADPPVVNIGDVQNTGWDIALTYHIGQPAGFHMNIEANVTTYHNMVVKVPDPGYFDVGIVRNQTGHPVSAFFGYDVIGFFRDDDEVAKSPVQQEAAPGRFKYRDVNNDGEITPDDRTFFGDPNPKITYGLNLNAGYKDFDFSMLLYGSQGNDVFNTLTYQTGVWDSYMAAKSNDLLFNSWTPDNLNPKLPIAQNASSFSTGGDNSFYKENGSFLKCRLVMLGYSLNPDLLRRFSIKKLRIFFQVENLFQITNYSGLDPELTSGFSTLDATQQSAAFGIDYANYPNNFRNYVFGLNLSF
ncbi:MAG TPA: TonB-dependent receptor [Parafilimonas sp.]|nr:TonB-dependent receptor [Parafilimonas sp.]